MNMCQLHSSACIPERNRRAWKRARINTRIGLQHIAFGLQLLVLAGALATATPQDLTEGELAQSTPAADTRPQLATVPPQPNAPDGVMPLSAPAGVTALSGQVVSTEGVPLPHVVVRDGTSTATTDEQ